MYNFYNNFKTASKNFQSILHKNTSGLRKTIKSFPTENHERLFQRRIFTRINFSRFMIKYKLEKYFIATQKHSNKKSFKHLRIHQYALHIVEYKYTQSAINSHHWTCCCFLEIHISFLFCCSGRLHMDRARVQARVRCRHRSQGHHRRGQEDTGRNID